MGVSAYTLHNRLAIVSIVLVAMAEQIVLNVIAQRVVIKLFANENVKHVVVCRLHAQLGKETFNQVLNTSNVSCDCTGALTPGIR